MDVIKKLQIKFIITVVIILLVVFSTIIIGINKFNAHQTESINEVFLTELIRNDGIMPNKRQFIGMEFSKRMDENGSSHIFSVEKHFTEPFENQHIRNYFSVKISKTGEIVAIISDFPLHYTDIEIENLVQAVFASENNNSTYDGMRYMIAEKYYGYLAVFTETRAESNMQSRLVRLSFVIFLICLILSVFIAWLLSIWAVKPVKISFEKQRRFVGDASHELKTPLSVIATNMDVLVSEVGENKWIGYIQKEVHRMSNLVKDLLYLAKSDASKEINDFIEFDLSRAITSAVLPFETLIFDSGKKLTINIQENVMYKGVQQRIEQLIIILLDNAIKYSYEGTEIKIELKTNGTKKIITVYNWGEGIPLEKQKLIYERFYRLDSSRNRNTGGFGLGLAIAKNIVDSHKGKIHLTSEQGKFTEFTIVL